MPRDGSLTLSDIREPTLSIGCERCDARQLREGALVQHLRPMQSEVRGL
jgi:hypothetical protein